MDNAIRYWDWRTNPNEPATWGPEVRLVVCAEGLLDPGSGAVCADMHDRQHVRFVVPGDYRAGEGAPDNVIPAPPVIRTQADLDGRRCDGCDGRGRAWATRGGEPMRLRCQKCHGSGTLGGIRALLTVQAERRALVCSPREEIDLEKVLWTIAGTTDDRSGRGSTSCRVGFSETTAVVDERHLARAALGSQTTRNPRGRCRDFRRKPEGCPPIDASRAGATRAREIVPSRRAEHRCDPGDHSIGTGVGSANAIGDEFYPRYQGIHCNIDLVIIRGETSNGENRETVCGCGGLCDSGHPCPMAKRRSLGEVGYPARPMHPDHVRSIVAQCKAASVPVLVKWGDWVPGEFAHEARPYIVANGGAVPRIDWEDSDGHAHVHWRVGVDRSGSMLDGAEVDELPEWVTAS